MSTIDIVEQLLRQDRGASEAEDARPVAPTAPMPLLTDEQCAATDDMAGFES